MFWKVEWYPRCTHHVFLSHCREDRERLAIPLKERLSRRGIICWLDAHDYPYGRTSIDALRQSILRSRHVVFLVTEGMLQQPRGWTAVELALADDLQSTLQAEGGVWQNVVLPAVFVPKGDPRIRQSVWQAVIERGVEYRAGDELDWVEEQIVRFVGREEQMGRDALLYLSGDPKVTARFPEGFVERITVLYPQSLPNPTG